MYCMYVFVLYVCICVPKRETVCIVCYVCICVPSGLGDLNACNYPGNLPLTGRNFLAGLTQTRLSLEYENIRQFTEHIKKYFCCAIPDARNWKFGDLLMVNI